MTFPSNYDFGALTDEQLNKLVMECGPHPVLLREIQLRALMARLPGMKRTLAVILLSEDKSDGRASYWSDGSSSDPHGETLAMLFEQHTVTEEQLIDFKGVIGECGREIFYRAVKLYMKSPSMKRAEINFTELLFSINARVENDSEGFDGDKANEFSEEFMNDLEDDDAKRCKEALHAIGIFSANDWKKLVQAMRLVGSKMRQKGEMNGSRAAWNTFVRKTIALRDAAQKFPDCWPADIEAWRSIDWRKANHNAIYKRPGGGAVWGDGTQVVYDKKTGQPRRRVASFFGGHSADNEKLDVKKVSRMVDKVYKNKQKKDSVN